MAISNKFNKFASAKKFTEARKQESMLTGCPLPVGTKGIALVGTIEDKETNEGSFPMILVTLEVEEPSEYAGKKLSGPGLMQTIKPTEKQTEEEAYARMLDMLEGLGLPRELREDDDKEFKELVAWFESEPRRVEYRIAQDTWAGNASGKKVIASAIINPDEVATSSDDSVKTSELELDPNKTYVEKFGVPHEVLEETEDGKLRIRSTKSNMVSTIDAKDAKEWKPKG